MQWSSYTSTKIIDYPKIGSISEYLTKPIIKPQNYHLSETDWNNLWKDYNIDHRKKANYW